MGWPDFLQYEGRQCRKALRDTVAFFPFNKRTILIAILGAIIGWPTLWYIAGRAQLIEEGIVKVTLFFVPFGIIFVGVLLRNLFLAPSHMKKDAETKHGEEIAKLNTELGDTRKNLQQLEEERTPKVIAEPFPTVEDNISSDRCALAELRIKNTSHSTTLEDVSVQIIECIGVFEKQDDRGKYFLHNGYQKWNPANIYWSERNAPPKQLTLPIPPEATRSALIAFRGIHNLALGIFNTPTHPVFAGGAKITVEVSNLTSAMWRGVYYIEYHSPKTDEFEFMEWANWEAKHIVINSSTADREDYQI